MLTDCKWIFVPTAIAVRGRKKVYMEKIGEINARRVRDAILEGGEYSPSKTKSIFYLLTR